MLVPKHKLEFHKKFGREPICPFFKYSPGCFVYCRKFYINLIYKILGIFSFKRAKSSDLSKK